MSNLGEPRVSNLKNSSNIRGDDCNVSSAATSSGTNVVNTLHDVSDDETETFLGVCTDEGIVVSEGLISLVVNTRSTEALAAADCFTVHFCSHFLLENVDHFSHHFDTLHSLDISRRFEREASSELTGLSNDRLTAEHKAKFWHLTAYGRVIRTEGRSGDLPAFSGLRIDAGTCIPCAVCVSGRTGITREARNCLPCGFDEFVRVIGLINVAECESKTDRTSQRLNTNENVSEELRENTTDECQRNRCENTLCVTAVWNTLVKTKWSAYALSKIFSQEFRTEVLSLLVFQKTCSIITDKIVLNASDRESARSLAPAFHHTGLCLCNLHLFFSY